MKITQLSVVVPVRNEQDNVASLIKEIDLALNAITHEIIYVNDGSTDATYARLKELQSQF
ncbi:MAG TPA: dolichol-phosphate mannosyltransferase, partial [Methylophilaceae bacterium]|nr:dolichol-phosphate mannosyltransferase [Methylophilaceae bacterium]